MYQFPYLFTISIDLMLNFSSNFRNKIQITRYKFEGIIINSLNEKEAL